MLYGIEGILNGKLFGGSSGGGESGGGGVGVAPMIDHGGGYVTFSPSGDTTIPAGGYNKVEVSAYDVANSTPVNGCVAGYLYGHPEITACYGNSAKYGWYLRRSWNSSATDFTFKTGETYTLVLLNPEA